MSKYTTQCKTSEVWKVGKKQETKKTNCKLKAQNEVVEINANR